MTSLFTARRRAEEFAAAVDGGARSVGAHRAEVAELVGVVTALRSHQDAAPRPEFVGDLRARLMTEAGTVLPDPLRRIRDNRGRDRVVRGQREPAAAGPSARQP